ncbi:MAG: hypothetical protein COU25_03755 [Candidatus Levybacteria bacterium CG10_big_fil_rev_8_21_14_0_10_35_13]|nr:MAG: hypothetical protein COU25_03755 [Candidatus Levybacteria bacterium CG10_big_fil_rev_8_21_14_0_10_35_13]
MKKTILFLAVLALLIVTACQYNYGNTTTNYTDFNDLLANYTVTQNDSESNVTSVANETNNSTQVDESKASFKITGTEGELIRIPVKAVDPDGDFLEYKFSEPFNVEGLWLTKIGDEGKYLVKVSVSDGFLSTSEYVLIDVLRANRPPQLECPKTITVQETETVTISCNVLDEEGDPVVIGYDGWMRTSSYKTDYGDAGEYSVIVRARDQSGETKETVKIIVEKKNRAPVIEKLNDLTVQETESVQIQPKVSDLDGDSVTVTYSAPFDNKGKWTPDFGDKGTYAVTVTATDGKDTTTSTFNLTVLRKNRAPVLKPIEDVVVKEGEMIRLPVQAYDPDGDEITTSYSGWMDSSEYQTTYDDAEPNGCNTKGCVATYYTTVTVSDGVLSASQQVKITVQDRNRPPEFLWG